VYPAGVSARFAKWVSVVLDNPQQHALTGAFSYAILSVQADNVYASYTDIATTPCALLGYRKFELRKDVLDPTKCCAAGAVTVRVGCRLLATPAARPDTLHALQIDIAALLRSGMHSDFTIVVGDQQFRVHRCILAARSQVFKAMFAHGMKEAKEGQVVIEGVGAQAMQRMLAFLYSGTLEMLEDRDEALTACEDLMRVADRFRVDSLIDLCTFHLTTLLTVSTVARILLLADACQLDQLKVWRPRHVMALRRRECWTFCARIRLAGLR
jgi:hypothetical protein